MAEKEQTESPITKKLKKIELSSYLPRVRTFSLFWVVILLLLAFLLPIHGKEIWFWSSGPIANPHKMIESDCARCHSQPFHPVQDGDCLACHAMTEHAPNYREISSKHPELEHRCAECHMDHNGDAHLTVKESELCTDCHGDIKKAVPDASNIAGFTDHPEFKAKDTSKIKLNHAVHLKPGLNGVKGRVTLSCNACHELASNFKDIKPIKFENHCQGCHSLGFDDRLPDTQVVHGDSEAVFPALFTAYSKLLLSKETGSVPLESARPGAHVLSLDSPKMMSIKDVVNASRAAEKELFTKTACFLCHETGMKPDSEQTDEKSHYKVTKPEIPDVWFTAAKFNHGAHEEISCESCHGKTRESTKTSDVLLPKIETCKECHTQERKQGMIQSDCVLCHSYHDMKPIHYNNKREISDYLSRISRG